MAVISVLDKAVSELIAAGEVIERPASVIKELLENAIDAGAKHITVEIKDGGTSFMRIVDDGCGMAAEDVPTAFLRHATSKIQEKADLDSILTFGFRGEALASVAAVARVTLLTKRPQDALGTSYEIAGTEFSPPEECGCPDGTTIVVKDLFFNVPARRKFMKSVTSEGNAISQIVQKIAISHPEIAFRFLRDNKVCFHSDGSGELLSVIHTVYGREFAGRLMRVDTETDDIRVWGYAVKPLYCRPNRSLQNFYVNTRSVRSRALTTALESAYENLHMVGKFPACVLFIDMQPDALDVNIHPAKAEVRFSDEKRVIDAVFFALKNAMVAEGLIYEIRLPQKDWHAGAAEPEPVQQPLLPEPPPIPVRPPVREPLPEMAFGVPKCPNVPQEEEVQWQHPMPEVTGLPPMPETSVPEIPRQELPPPAVQEEKQPLPFPDVKVIGELFANYILAQSGETFIIIDKHAAHERVIFERLRKENCQQYRQMLLTPCQVMLTMEEIGAMEENTALLERLGFIFDFENRPYVKALAAPVFFAELDIDEIVQEVAHNLYLGKVNPQAHMLDDMFHEMACKSAIRANDKNALPELQTLAECVCHDENIRHCPHGRPVMFTLSKYELEKQFRRRV